MPRPKDARAASHTEMVDREAVDLSVVVPMYNEEDGLDIFFRRLLPVLDRLDMRYEVVCVNDGSKDETLARLVELRASNPAIKVVGLSRNFGKEIALAAGIDYARGGVIVPIDADLQDPPELIPELVAKWREGFDVVYATRQSRHSDSLVKRATAALFYRSFDRLASTKIPHNTGDFRLIDRCVADVLTRMPERARFMKGLFAWVGFRQTKLLYDREERGAGKSKWKYRKLWNLAIDGIISFSTVPLRVWTYVGLVISSLAFLYAGFLVIRTLVRGVDVPGYASLMVVVLFLGGIQLLTLGIIGEYLGRVYEEVKGRPLYVVSETHGFDEDHT